MEGKATERPAVWAVGEGGVDVGCEGAATLGKGEAKIAGVDEVGGHAADLAPGEFREAALVDESGENLEGEKHVTTYVGDEAGKADDAASEEEVFDNEGVRERAGGCEEAFEGVATEGGIEGGCASMMGARRSIVPRHVRTHV